MNTRSRFLSILYFGSFFVVKIDKKMDYISVEDALNLGSTFDVFLQSDPVAPDMLEQQVNPPLVRLGDELIWGFSLLAAAQRARIDALPVTTIEATFEQACMLMLRLEARTDRYTFDEKLRIKKLIERLGISDVTPELLVLVQTSGSFIDQAAKYGSLSPACRRLVAAGRIALKHAYRLDFLPEYVWERFTRADSLTVSELRLSATYIEEIMRRDSLAEPAVQRMLDEVFGVEDPLQALRRIRFPRLTSMEKSFHALRENNLAGSGVRLVAPTDFEGDSFEVSFKFRSKKELNQRLRDAGRIPTISDELFDLL